MGEFAYYRGRRIKIGTCEDMMYLRADQRHLVDGYSFDGSERFRFPFPDEDGIEPGCFGDPDRGLRLLEVKLPDRLHGHRSVQFVSRAGYVLSIPCPEQFGQPGLTVNVPVGDAELRVGRNGFDGHPRITQQIVVGDELWTVIACGACGACWRLDHDLMREVVAALRQSSDYYGDRAANQLIADRIEAGYTKAHDSLQRRADEIAAADRAEDANHARPEGVA